VVNSDENLQENHVIIFTRYPEPGTTKTRMIPLLGEIGAANLHKLMTEHTLKQVQELQKELLVSGEVRFIGGSLELMQAWLGLNCTYSVQGEGDLGQKMVRSLTEAFARGASKVVIIGTDCPGINAKILATAFEQLAAVDVVLGPALDGGYYLIGLKEAIPELFFNIEWGTAQVFAQTVATAHQQNLSLSHLTPLSDVDRPEDIYVWEQIASI
jgi:rSAM/selenodomain-associated transferase 1